MNTSEIRLFRPHRGSIGWWSIQVRDWDIHITHAQSETAQSITTVEKVPEGKAGRSRKEQILSRVRSRMKKQLDRGYTREKPAVDTVPTNAMQLPQPMLAQTFAKATSIDEESLFAQPKWNGHRCLIARVDGALIAYSRNGKPITSIPHILREMEDDLPESMILDGELYVKGMPLQTISSLIRREQVASEMLKFICFDQVLGMPFKTRFEDVVSTLKPMNLSATVLAPTVRIKLDQVPSALVKAIDTGYEGLILRHSDAPYEIGRRSYSLVKVKKFHDTEYKVVDVESSRLGHGILICETDKGQVFKVTAPGTHEEKAEVLANPDNYVGKLVTVKYAELTKSGVPFHPVSESFRELD